eukprot:CAMPEP_0194304432 /NCGR_PEP_ID=MMETSP0171-20130528/2202_1 /TAXON_ID=218684 /ORGANISM="Corethron pennatum, Strain L29A3" /LENGTH=78 /DNA_ID=CAMNT_0039055725 /DNA_START=8 /DNA_END=244 /DNA_ORIENTATION=-
MTRVSAYYIKDSEVTPKEHMSGVAMFGFSLFIGVVLLLVIYQIYSLTRKESLVNQGEVPSLPGAEGIVKDANKDLDLI